MRRTSSIGVVGACSLLVLMMSAASASAQTQTAQSAMVGLKPDSTAYQIDGTITWTFNRGNQNDLDLTGTAMSYYINALNNALPTITSAGVVSTGGLQPGSGFTQSQAGGTFGMLRQTVERTVGLGTSRQIQFALRLNF